MLAQWKETGKHVDDATHEPHTTHERWIDWVKVLRPTTDIK